MNIAKAIKTNTDFEKGYRASVETEVHDAIKMGIEALKRLERQRIESGRTDVTLLPGETEN